MKHPDTETTSKSTERALRRKLEIERARQHTADLRDTWKHTTLVIMNVRSWKIEIFLHTVEKSLTKLLSVCIGERMKLKTQLFSGHRRLFKKYRGFNFFRFVLVFHFPPLLIVSKYIANVQMRIIIIVFHTSVWEKNEENSFCGCVEAHLIIEFFYNNDIFYKN
jgi:hypothetical protein